MKKIIHPFLAFALFSCVADPVQPNNGGNGGGSWPDPVGEMRTSFSEDWDNWDFYIGDTNTVVVEFETAFSEDWDNWDATAIGFTADIQTVFSEDWDNWRLTNGNYTIDIETAFSEDWDNWDIDDNANGWHCDVRTSFSEDWDNWDADDISNGMHVDLQTAFSEDYDNWDVDGAWDTSYPLEYKVAIMAVPVIVNVLLIQGLIP